MNKGTVAAGGVFDIFHAGHASLFKYCKTLGDKVIVLLNSDESVERIRGVPPVVPEDLRRFSLEACRWVDKVLLFDGDAPLDELNEIQPEYFVKGAEPKYLQEEGNARIVEADVVEGHGGIMAWTPVLELTDRYGETHKVSSSYLKDLLNINFNIDLVQLHNEIDPDHEWGYQIRMVNNQLYSGKFMILENGKRGGHHWHEEKTETFIILQDEVFIDVAARDENGWSTVFNGILRPGEQVTIHPMERHWMENSFGSTTIILEVSTHDSDEDTYYVDKDSG